jgi:hypothetical protein
MHLLMEGVTNISQDAPSANNPTADDEKGHPEVLAYRPARTCFWMPLVSKSVMRLSMAAYHVPLRCV